MVMYLIVLFGVSLVVMIVVSLMDVIRMQMMGVSLKIGGRVFVLGILRYFIYLEGYCWVFCGWILSFIWLGLQMIVILVIME